jgi:CHAT domain-containing protein
MTYEHAKSLLSLAQAEAMKGSTGEARKYLFSARCFFEEQQNPVSVALIDMEEAVLERRSGHTAQAWRLSQRAASVLNGPLLPGKAESCALLSAQLLLDRGEILRARDEALSSLRRLQDSEYRAQRIQAYSLLARIEEQGGRKHQALALWEAALNDMDKLRGMLSGESFRISFLKDKLLVYAALARHYIARGEVERAFRHIEQAKSRSMVEMLALPEVLPPDRELDELLKDLNADYRQLEAAAAHGRLQGETYLESLRERARRREEAATRRFNALGFSQANPSAWAGDPLAHQPELSLDDIRRAIPPKGLLIEYYEIEGVFHICLIDHRQIQIVPLPSGTGIRRALRFFQLQISRMRIAGDDGIRVDASVRTAEWHLRELYNSLLAPIAQELNGREHLVIVPHGFLHEVPFHALFDGTQFVMDRFMVSFAPSASVLARCDARPFPNTEESLILGVPDKRTPSIEGEARAVAATIPGARLFLGPEATEDVMRERGPHSRLLHIATHGVFRRDQPLFSGIRLGDSTLSVINLYRLPLVAEMATLSGCSTGLNAVTGADELLGMIRGVLYAGARSVLASLWDVNDESTTLFMTRLYGDLQAEGNKAQAVQRAMREVRKTYPHPYHWAPFILVGAVRKPASR